MLENILHNCINRSVVFQNWTNEKAPLNNAYLYMYMSITITHLSVEIKIPQYF